MAERKIRWYVVPRKGGGFRGKIFIPLGPSLTLPVPGNGDTRRDALANAAGLAEQIASNPLLRAALPPGSGAAIEATKYLAKAAGAGKLAKKMKNLVGPGAKRVAKTLSKLKFW
jgi:hypothetical protein